MGRGLNLIDIRRTRACLRSKLSQKINLINHQYNFARILTRHATISRFSGARTKIFGGTPPKSPRMCACVRVCCVRAASQCAGGRVRAHSPLRGSCEPLTSFWLTSVIDDDGLVIIKITDDVRVAVARTVIRACGLRRTGGLRELQSSSAPSLTSKYNTDSTVGKTLIRSN